jgi:hypothetical protein
MIWRFSVLARVFVLFTVALLLPIRPLRGGGEMEFITVELPWAAVDKGYAPAPFEVRSGGSCPLGGIGYAVVSGTLPQGLQLSRLGYFSGTASRVGTYVFTIRVSNGCSQTEKQFTLVVSAAPVLTIAPMHLIFIAAEGEGAPGQNLLVSSTWPSLPYGIKVTDGEWLTALPEQGRTPGPVAIATGDSVRVRIDASRLKPGHYAATLMFSAWQAAPAAAVVVELAVLAK